MSSESALAQASLLLTYLLRTAIGYLLLSLLSRLIRNSQVRFWLHGLFLSAAITVWLCLLLSFGLPGLSFQRGTASGALPSRHFLSWSVDPAALPHLAKVLSLAFWCYAIIVLLLLVRFSGHSWRLGNFLRASQPAPDALAFLFELVRSETGFPPCELRLVDGVRSPATAGWRKPKVLLPANLLARLHAQQLVHVFQHELTHVRRRDYLWDRLSTVGCYLIFFHPAAWLARRTLRWERELVCDESVVPRSVEGRLEYASCLTTLAAWWFLQENPAGPVDFLSPRSSLLAARVRALLAKPSMYGPQRKIGLTVFAACCSILVALVVPRMVILSHQIPALADAQFSSASHNRPSSARAHRHRKPPTAVPRIILSQKSTLPDLTLPVVLPKFSPEATDQRSYDRADSVVSSSNADSGEYSPSPVWDESPPQAPRRRRSKIGSVALRALQVGIGIAASQIGDHEHEKEH
jgi:beta-lactamase regulating signal transducer with metallopeptidase domain